MERPSKSPKTLSGSAISPLKGERLLCEQGDFLTPEGTNRSSVFSPSLAQRANSFPNRGEMAKPERGWEGWQGYSPLGEVEGACPDEERPWGKKDSLRIVYMGTPDFAVEALRCLVEGGYNVVGVVTMPDKPIGRHQTELSQSPVKQYAVSKGLPVLQPERLKDEAFIEELRALHADLQIVVAFRMLPEVVWQMPRLGTFNLHASLLPRYRGAAPINWAIINGDTETGITTFFLQHAIDTGHIIQQERIPITPDDNAETIHDRLMLLGGRLVTETVDNILAGRVRPIPQEEMTLPVADHQRQAPKIFKDTCRIDWSRPIKQTYDFIRGLSPYPGAWSEFEIGGKMQVLKIFASRNVENVDAPLNVGTLFEGDGHLYVQQSDGVQELLIVQLAGKKRMPAADFLRGVKL